MNIENQLHFQPGNDDTAPQETLERSLNWKKISPYLIPSITNVFFISLFIVLSVFPENGLLNDGDTGFHIRIGEYIMKNLAIPKNDPFSFISPPLFFTAHEWLSAVIMESIHSIAGLTGVVLFFASIISLTYSLLFKLFVAENDNIFISVALVLLLTVSSAVHWLARPHAFTLLFTVIWYYLLHKHQESPDRNLSSLCFMPLIMVFWVNLHGGFLVGFILNGICILGNLVEYVRMSGEDRNILRQKMIDLFSVTLFCVLVCLINPYGWHILIFPFQLISQDFMINYIGEFQSPNFHTVLLSFFKYSVLLSIALIALSKKRLKPHALISILVFLSMSLTSVRHVPLFCIIVFPILLGLVRPMIENPNSKIGIFFHTRSARCRQTDAQAKGALWPVIVVILVITAAGSERLTHGFDPELKPMNAMAFINSEDIPGNMFNEYETGDFIIYSTWPRYKVFIDGRADMYGEDHLKAYDTVIKAKQGWQDIIEKHDITWMMVNPSSPISSLLWEMPGWHLIYADKVSHVYVRNIRNNQRLVEKYQNIVPVDTRTDELTAAVSL
ncbi:MAG: hypothetical protein AB7S77_23865 [Desulfatirhabdiaceae bacterium]